jgi:hypothetical protein
MWRSSCKTIIFICVVSILLLRRQEDRTYFNCAKKNPPNYLDQKCARYI